MAPPTQRSYLLSSLTCTACAIFCAWAAATRSSGLEAPPLVMYAVAFVFALNAVRLLQLRENAGSSGDGFAFLFCSAMSAIGGWIAFGSGPRACTGSLGGADAGQLSGLACRVPFGVGAVITAGMAVYCGVRILRSQRAPSAEGQ